MDSDARLHLRAAVWGREDNRIAVLQLEGHPGFATAPEAVVATLLAMGLAPLTDVRRLRLPRPTGWRILLGPMDELTLWWPRRTPLVREAGLDLPGAWRWAARRRAAVVLVAGERLGLTGSRPTPLSTLAEAGELAAGAIPFTEHPRH